MPTHQSRKKSDFALDDRARFAWQHDFRQRRNGTCSVFDNGARWSGFLPSWTSPFRLAHLMC
jgi:hypothetical protein